MKLSLKEVNGGKETEGKERRKKRQQGKEETRIKRMKNKTRQTSKECK